MNRRGTRHVFATAALLLVYSLCGTAVRAEPVTVDAAALEQLQRQLREQQQQLDALQRQLDQLRGGAAAPGAGVADTAAKPPPAAPPAKTVTSGVDRVALSVSGQLNRAVNVIDDGKNTQAYYVDNDSSNSRVRFVATARATDDLTIGSKIEVAFAPNESADVSQNDEESGDFMDERWAEVSVASKQWGSLALGKGDTASNNSAEVDLSRTDVVQYASVASIAAGMLFRQSGDDSLTGVKLSDAFKNFDGLSRKSRLRYDTPAFHGFKLAGSLVSDQRWDASLWWGVQGHGLKAAAALALSEPNESGAGMIVAGSVSVLHESSGLNLTLSAGMQDRDDQGDPSNLWAKLGWLTTISDLGPTAFGLDYNRTVNLPTGRDDGYSVGAAVVQQVADYGTELYLQYRLYSLDRAAAPSVADLNVVTGGARVKF